MDDLENVKQTKKTHNFKTLTYYLKKKEKMAVYRKDLIKQLVNTGYYNELYYRFIKIDKDEDLTISLNENDVKILETVDYITPTELNKIYQELFNI